MIDGTDGEVRRGECPDADRMAQRLDDIERMLSRGEGLAAVRMVQSLAVRAGAGALLGLRHAELMDACGQPLRALLELQAMCVQDGASAATWMQLGFMLLRLERLEAARQAFERAVDLAPRDPVGWEALASIEQALGRAEQAAQIWQELLRHHPEDPVALSALWWQAQSELDWHRAEALEPRLLEALQTGSPRSARVSRYVLLGMPEDWPISLFRDLPTHPVTGPVARFAPRQPRRPGRLRVAYQSAHFLEHATTLLAVGLFECHDRGRVETFAFNLGAARDDAYRRRCRAAFEHWIDVYGESDASIARRIYEHDIDVLIDLDADNIGGRSGIAARRPARLQMHFLGHPGSTSVEGLDCFIGDATTLPPGAEAEFRETLVRLPRCYQPNDPARPLPRPCTRADVGLPPQGLALCNFNQAWKWRREVFDLWVDVLARSPDATLTLLDPGPVASARLLRYAHARGLADADRRLRYAPLLRPADHLDRLTAFDLALDQWPYGAHTTTSDALWAGVPTLTRPGRRFAGRVAASILRAAGASAWVAADTEEYRVRLLGLCQNRQAVDAFRRQQADRVRSAALYDMPGFARDLEDAIIDRQSPAASPCMDAGQNRLRCPRGSRIDDTQRP